MSTPLTLNNRLVPPPPASLCTCEADSVGSGSAPHKLPRSATMTTPQKPADAAAKPATQDTTDRIRAAILAAARLLLGTDGPYTGDVLVKVTAPGNGIEVRVKPTANASGLEATANTLASGDAMLMTHIKQLQKHLLSVIERMLLRKLVEMEPCTASQVQVAAHSEITKSDFWCVWGQLQHRGFIHQQDDKKYVLAVDWVRELIGEV